jgi:hypothetical protein
MAKALKRSCLMVVAVLAGPLVLRAADLEVRVVTDGDASTANSGFLINVFIQARLDSGAVPTSDGLALIGTNLSVMSSGGAPVVDLCDTLGFVLTAPLDMQSFDRKDLLNPGFSEDGLTNPRASVNLSGYSGTCDGAGGLLQIGGGQNTIGNTLGGAPYPIGAVVLGKGNGGWQTIAEGTFDVPQLILGSLTLAVDGSFAMTLDPGGSVPFPVSPATVIDETGTLVITGPDPLCAPADVNCNGTIDVGDIGVIANPLNFQQSPPACDRADVNNSGTADVGDIGVIANPLYFQTGFGGPCFCVTATPEIAGCPTGLMP